MDSTLEINNDMTDIDSYDCVFLAKHPHNMEKSDEFSRFWPKWYKYTRCSQTNQIIFGDRYLIRPNHTPNKNNFIQWSDNISLCSVKSQSIIGPFNLRSWMH